MVFRDTQTWHYSTTDNQYAKHNTCYDGTKDQVDLAVKYSNMFTGYNDHAEKGNCYNAGFVQDLGNQPASRGLPYTVHKWHTTQK